MEIASYIDHTILKPTALLADIETLCSEAIKYKFVAVCVPPLFVKKAAALLTGTGIKVATVIGFPFGYSAIEAKVAEIVLAIVDGADELDMVIKIIIETGLLTNDEIIKCCDLYGAAGVDFLKTSTGYAEKGATVEAVQLLRKHLADKINIKASGGIKTYTFARQLIDAGANRLGCSSSVKIVNEASQLN
jgi:deoxyribose-phosphate aldolase